MTAKDLREQLDKSGSIAFVPSGDSMWPIIKNKSKTVLITKKQNRLCVYDVGMFERKNGRVVLHRVKEVLPNGYIFQGDSQMESEEVLEDMVFGVFKGYFTKKSFVGADEEKFIKRVKKWIEKRDNNCLRLKLFKFRKRVKAKLKRMLKIKEEQNG